MPHLHSVLHDYGINWIWYLVATFDEANKSCTIHAHYRLHKGEGVHPVTKKGYRLIEDDKRTVTGVRVGEHTYTVLNPAHIFAYDARTA